MRLLTLVAAVSLAFAAGCDRNTSTTPSPKTDTQSSAAQPSAPVSASGSTTASGTTSSAAGTPSMPEKREGANPQQGQVDPKAADQRRDFQQNGDQAGPKSAETTPVRK